MSIESNPYYPEGFFVSDLAEVQAKIGAIAAGGAGLLEARLDFDRTMTTNGSKDITSWDVLSELLPPDARAEDERLWHKYRPREINHTLTIEQAEKWWSESLQLHVDSSTNVHAIEDAARSITLRPGVHEFFQHSNGQGIYTTILSAGVKDVIDVVADRYKLRPSLVLSTKLEKNPVTGIVTDWDRASVIHLLNKGEKGSPLLSDVRRQRPNTIVIGDALEDTSMADDHDDGVVLRIRVGDPHKINPRKASEYMEESFLAGYDMVRLGDFYPINAMASWIIWAANRDAE